MRIRGLGRRLILPRCDVCDDTRFIAAAGVFGRDPVCTCGAGEPGDEMVLHAVDCDAVPCPFDQLLCDSASLRALAYLPRGR